MARDEGLETLLNDDLAAVPGLTQKAMFGGWAWLVNGNLLCGARIGSVLVRLAPNKDAWTEDPGHCSYDHARPANERLGSGSLPTSSATISCAKS